jgi:hypothetical protein
MDRCEICNRYPARPMLIKGGQCYRLVSKVDNASVLCRDHAIHACISQGCPLPDWLPDEVKDEPWVTHFVACPQCGAVNRGIAGPQSCYRCRLQYGVASCESCGTVHVLPASGNIELVTVRCRCCAHETPPPLGVRNAQLLLAARAAAEVSAVVAVCDGPVDRMEWRVFADTLAASFAFQRGTLHYLHHYFTRCLSGQSDGILGTLPGLLGQERLFLLFRIGTAVATADGELNGNERAYLSKLSRVLGIEPAPVLQHRQRHDRQSWWSVLGLSEDATTEIVASRYRELAMQCHPDLWAQRSDSEHADAEQRMRDVNAAFEEAMRDGRRGRKGVGP